MSARCRPILMVLFLTPLVHAAPAWQGELTSPAPGPFAKLPPTVLDYQVSWNGAIDAGRIRMEFAPPDVKKAGTLIVRASAASQGAGAVLFPYQTNFWSEIAPTSLRPRYFHGVETDPKETVKTTVRHSPARVESEEIARQLKTGTTKRTDHAFAFAPVFDIFSAMLLVRSQKLATGDHVTLAIYPFDRPYLLRVNVQGRELHNGRNSIRLTLGLRKIDRDTLELQPYKKLKQDATLWLSDDADRVPIELRATAFIGDVRATLAAHRKP
jgi:Protein of unknown function (DUF3108)